MEEGCDVRYSHNRSYLLQQEAHKGQNVISSILKYNRFYFINSHIQCIRTNVVRMIFKAILSALELVPTKVGKLFLSKLGERTAEIALNSLESMRDFELTAKILEKNLRLLSAKASDVEEQIKNAELSGHKKRKREVEKWLEQVKSIENEWETQVEPEGIMRRLMDGGKAAELNQLVENLFERSHNFGELLLDVCETKGVRLLTTGMVGEAFEKNLERIWRLLEAGEVLRIGIHGMGGSGKSELAKHINNGLVEQSQGGGFLVVVSEGVSITSLQDKIAHSVGAKDIFDANDEVDERAAKLHEFLSEEKKNSVLILDDMWEYIDLFKVGCPISTGCCRLIITTRSLEVCHQMRCQEIIAVQKLNEDDAWKLFSETLSLKLSPQVEKIAKSVANFCDGLPLAIKVVAGSMRGREKIHTWRNRLLELKECLVGEIDQVFTMLKYSFDRLNKKHDKSQSDEEFNLPQLCFLYCSLYPEDYEIPREELVRNFISEGLLNQRKSRREQFDQGYCILDTLEEACLLENCVNYDGRKCVKMHDLVRGMALKICEGKYMVRAGKYSNLKEIPKEEEWTEDLEKVSLMGNDIWGIPDGTSPPSCPKLSTLLLQGNIELEFIPDSFFTEMQGLCTLDLSGSKIKKLPNSISELKILKALLLECCYVLEYVPNLGKLKGLRELNLDHTAIKEVPQGVEELLNLKFLSIEAEGLKMLPEGLLLKLVRLQCVRLPKHLHAAIEEVKNLKELVEFSGTVKNVSDYNSFVTSRVHDTFYRILVQSSTEDMPLPYLEVLEKRTKNKKVILTECNLKDEKVLLEQDIECLSIIDCILDGFGGVTILKAGEVGPQALFSSLNRLEISRCYKIRKLGLPVLAFPNLEFIRIWRCHDMEEIFEDEGRGSDVSLPRLRVLRLDDLPSLKRVCKATIICNSIEKISIFQCPRLMKKLPLHLDDPLPPNLKYIMVLREWWESLEWDNPNLPTLLQSLIVFSFQIKGI